MQGSVSVGAFMTGVAVEKLAPPPTRAAGSSAELRADQRSMTSLPKAEAVKPMTPETVTSAN